MFIEDLKAAFGTNEPIFSEEILKLFPRYTRAYVFRCINRALEKKELIRADTGVYYIPEQTPLGLSVITPEEVARKKYIENNNETFGLYSGLALQNAFSLTTQLPVVSEIVTNNEATRGRKVTIDGVTFILRKSRVKITNENINVYRILQLFSEQNGIQLNDTAKRRVRDFMRTKRVSRSSLLNLSRDFPARTLKNLVTNEIL